MSNNVITIGWNLTPEQVKSYEAEAQKFLGMARIVAALTPTQADDKIVAFAQKCYDIVTPLLDKPGFVEAVNFIIQLFQTSPEKAQQVLAAARQAAQ
jgi:hypothetical protein